jgi:hypothetical protein
MDKQPKIQFLVRLTPEQKAWVEEEAAKNFTSQNSVIVRSVALAMMEQVGAAKKRRSAAAE